MSNADTKLTNYRGQFITLDEYHSWERKYDQYLDETGVYRFPDLGVEMLWVISRNYYSTFDESYEKLKKPNNSIGILKGKTIQTQILTREEY